MKFGENLKKLRKKKNISQEELAFRVGVSRQSVSKWECGESYPTMENILLLCNIFHCKLNDLVHESMTDISLMEEDVKVGVMKLSYKKQQQMKILSKVIYRISSFLKWVSIFCIFFLCILFFILPFLSFHVTWDGSSTVSFYNKQVSYEILENEIILKDEKGEYHLQNYNEVYPLLQGIHFLETHDLSSLLWFTEVILVVLIITLYFFFRTFSLLERLFINIHHGDTPFTLENVTSIKKIADFMILSLIIPSLMGTICEFVFSVSLGIGFELVDFIYILFLYSMSYIFLYGYHIQLDSKGKLYTNNDF